jgi:large subunit ribosomal protein L4
MDSKIYNTKGDEIGKVSLPERIFNAKWNPSLVHQVVVSMLSNARENIAHTKGRSDVRGGGKKPWRQKGTGRARHGSRRSPIWRGGGVTFGPTNEKNFTKKINKKMKSSALGSVLSQKMRDGEVLFLDSIGITEIKTKSAKDILNNLSKIKGFDTLASKKHNAAFIFIPNKDEVSYKSFRNFGNVAVEEFRNMNVLDALQYKYLIIVDPKTSINST